MACLKKVSDLTHMAMKKLPTPSVKKLFDFKVLYYRLESPCEKICLESPPSSSKKVPKKYNS